MSTSAPTAEPLPQSTPTSSSPRIPLLDVLRGVAILGTLGANIWIFTALGSEGLIVPGDLANPEDPAQSIFMMMFNGKFLAMLTLMFGVGLAIQYQSAAKRGKRWPGKYHWRALFLFVEGAVHFTLIFAFDVLMGYAVTAIVVAWLLTRSNAARRATLWIAGSLHLLIAGLVTLALLLEPDVGAEDLGAEDVVDLYAAGSWWDLVLFRLDHAIFFRIEAIVVFPMMLCLFLIGVRLFRAGAFASDETGHRIRNRLMLLGFGVGLPFNLLTSFGPWDLFMLDRYVAAPILMFGYVGLIGWALNRFRPGRLVNAMSALGKSALSGYVLQNVIASVACYGFGLGLAQRYSDAGPWWVMGLWLAISLFLLVGASWWVRRFSAGPLEMLNKKIIPR